MGKKRAVSAELKDLRTQVLKWRERDGGGRGSRIPDELWQAAVRVARVDGVYATSQATRFNYDSLRERCRRADGLVDEAKPVADAKGQTIGETRIARVGSATVKTAGADARFIALPLPPPRPTSQTTIELVGRKGDRMRVELAGDVDLAGLLSTFWIRQS